MISKTAKSSRQKRKDPIQEEIVSRKDSLNERTTKLIDFLKELKRGWNGGPAPTIGIGHKSNLTAPLPEQVIGAGQAASSALTDILNGLGEVKNLQDHYATERERRLAERTQKVQQAMSEFVIQKTASNPLSIMWSHIVAPFSTEQGKWERLRMLRSLDRMDDNLLDINEKILGNEKDILDAIYLTKQMYLDSKSGFFEIFQKNLNSMMFAAESKVAELENELKAPKDKIQANPVIGNKPITIVTPEITATKTGPVTVPVNTSIPSTVKEVVETQEPTTSTLSETILSLEKEMKGLKQSLRTNVTIPIISTTKKKTTKKPTLELLEQEENELQPNENEDELLQSTVKDDQEPFEQPSEGEQIIENIDTVKEEIVPETILEPEISPEEIRKQKFLDNRKFILESVGNVYNEIKTQKGTHYEDPNPWGDRVYHQWLAINKTIQEIKSSKSLRVLINNYRIFIKSVGDLTATLLFIQKELEEQKTNPDFVWGSTLNESKLEQEAINFLHVYDEKLKQKFEETLKSEASNRFNRGFKRMMTYLSSDKAKHIKINIDKNIQKTRDGLEQMMDNLEQRNINFRSLIDQSSLFYDSIIETFDKMGDLADMYNSAKRMEKADKKTKKETFRFDFIPVTDISNLRFMKTKFQEDKNKIQRLHSAEIQISKFQNILKELQERIDNVM